MSICIDLTKVELALRLYGIGSSTTLELIKEGSTRKDISTKTVIAIADYFNVSIDEMIGRVDKHYKPNK